MNTVEQVREIFSGKGYVHLPDLLKKEDCKKLVAVLCKAKDEGKTAKDTQCPKSHAVHGLPELDDLMEQLTPYFEQATGKRLHPTYSYARLYAEGDVLKPHTDRPACEISATITLGADGPSWPIHMADKAVEGNDATAIVDEHGIEIFVSDANAVCMDVGGAVLYRGMDKVHWREPYAGKQQTQVFLHYVDADGANAEWKYDKREGLSHHNTEAKKPPVEDVFYWTFSDVFSAAECQALINGTENSVGFEEAQVGIRDQGVVDKSIRDVHKLNIPLTSPVSAMMAGLGHLANKQAWKFEVNAQNQTDFLRYTSQGHYRTHMDTFLLPSAQECRKLTVLMFLNEDFEGGRLYLQLGDNRIYPPQSAGSLLVFPSFILHGVEPVTSGVRRSVVTWLSGPWFK